MYHPYKPVSSIADITLVCERAKIQGGLIYCLSYRARNSSDSAVYFPPVFYSIGVQPKAAPRLSGNRLTFWTELESSDGVMYQFVEKEPAAQTGRTGS